jgi:hypothetical protein
MCIAPARACPTGPAEQHRGKHLVDCDHSWVSPQPGGAPSADVEVGAERVDMNEEHRPERARLAEAMRKAAAYRPDHDRPPVVLSLPFAAWVG